VMERVDRLGAGEMFSVGRIARAVDGAIVIGARTVLLAAMIGLFGTVTVDVTIRYFTSQSLPWSSEMPDLLFPWATMAGIVLAAQWGNHMAVEFLLRLMPNGVIRAVAVLGHVAAAVTFVFLAWTGLEILDITSTERMPVTRIPQSWAYLSMVLGFLLLGVTSLTSIPRVLAGRDPLTVREPPMKLDEGGAG